MREARERARPAGKVWSCVAFVACVVGSWQCWHVGKRHTERSKRWHGTMGAVCKYSEVGKDGRIGLWLRHRYEDANVCMCKSRHLVSISSTLRFGHICRPLTAPTGIGSLYLPQASGASRQRGRSQTDSRQGKRIGQMDGYGSHRKTP